MKKLGTFVNLLVFRERYASNKEGTLNTILYLQIETEKGAVVSGHIDIRYVFIM